MLRTDYYESIAYNFRRAATARILFEGCVTSVKEYLNDVLGEMFFLAP